MAVSLQTSGNIKNQDHICITLSIFFNSVVLNVYILQRPKHLHRNNNYVIAYYIQGQYYKHINYRNISYGFISQQKRGSRDYIKVTKSIIFHVYFVFNVTICLNQGESMQKNFMQYFFKIVRFSFCSIFREVVCSNFKILNLTMRIWEINSKCPGKIFQYSCIHLLLFV